MSLKLFVMRLTFKPERKQDMKMLIDAYKMIESDLTNTYENEVKIKILENKVFELMTKLKSTTDELNKLTKTVNFN